MSKAEELFVALGLKVVRRAASGRYASAGPGPAPGYLYWVTHSRGGWKFGVQSSLKAPFQAAISSTLKANQFQLTSAESEAYVSLGDDLSSAIPRARAAMALLSDCL